VSRAIDGFYQSAQRTLDTDDSVVGVGARSGVWTWERDSVSAFSEKNWRAPKPLEKLAPCRQFPV
jgi:hypothetical protein